MLFQIIRANSRTAMSLQTSASRLIQRQLRQLASVKPVAGPSSCLCTCSTATSWASRSRWQSTRSQSTSTAGSNVEEQVPSPEDHDIVIVGGGLVGLALANALCMSDRTLVSFFIRTSPSLRPTLVHGWPLVHSLILSYISYCTVCRHEGLATGRQRS